MNTFVFLSLATLILYMLKMQQYKHNWEKYPEVRPSERDILRGISIIVAFRNEESNLGTLLSSLKKQDYPPDLYEVILVNDHSCDGSEVLVRGFCETNPNFILINNEGKAAGKKSALINGVRSASNELIVTTDADCTMNACWLSTIARFYCQNSPDMIIGLVDITPGNSFFEKFQEIEFLSLIAAGAGAAAGQKPIYCNAACFAFRKDLFESMDDPLQQVVPSGDDTLFMHAVKKNRKKSIMLLKSVAATVVTEGPTTWSGYYNQRRRWISKSRHYRDSDIIYTALLVLMVNLGVIYALVLLAMGLNSWLFPVFYVGKTIADMLFLKGFMQFYNKKLPMILFMSYAVVYPFYAIFFAIAGLFSGYSWKGRVY